MEDETILALARALVAAHGIDAGRIAQVVADALLSAGDSAQYNIWLRVVNAIDGK